MKKNEHEGSPYETPAPYGDGDTPEIDLPGKATATRDIPDELPGRSQTESVPAKSYCHPTQQLY